MSALAIAAAVWLGIQTSISPCPLATNIAAVSFIAGKTGQTGRVLLCGLLYAIGRTIVYVVIGVVIMAGLLANWEVAPFLDRYVSKAIGPLLILAGMFLTGLLNATLPWSPGGKALQDRVSRGGIWWSAVLGMLFALAFCPISAGLFFGGLLPLSIECRSMFLLPALYGVGTALPVLVFAFIIAFASQYIGKAFHRLTQVEKWLRAITGVVFIAAGVYCTLVYIFDLSILS